MTPRVGTPLVSCVIPVFDGERFLGEAIDSVLAQSWPELEVLVVDDASTDATAGIARRYGDPVRHIALDRNRGPSAARNRGLDEARGEFVAFLDADDRWLPQKLSAQMRRMEGLDLCFTTYRHIWAEELADEERRYDGHPMSGPIHTQCISTLLTRPSMFDRVGRFDESRRLGENMPIFMEARRLDLRIEVLPDVLAERRFHAGSTTRHDMDRSRDAFLDILKDWRDMKRSHD